jgi:4-azaleucine resistance transporter AzlC
METPRSAFRAGMRDQAPIILGMIPFGLIAGAAPVAAGMDPWLAIAMNVIVYAGAAQLAAVSLMAQHVPVPIVIATVLVVNLRFVMYSAALAPYFARLSTGKKWLYSYVITDHGFALLTAKMKPDAPIHAIDNYYRGVAVMMWMSWNTFAIIGALVGARVPASWSLDFTIPLVFLALVLPSLTSRAHWWAAGVASVMAVFTFSMPLKLGLITSALVGVAVGTWLDLRQDAIKKNPGSSG